MGVAPTSIGQHPLTLNLSRQEKGDFAIVLVPGI